MLWSYKKPTEPGLYFVNSGDAVTEYSLEVRDLVEGNDDGDLVVMCDRGEIGSVPISDWNDSYKFLPIDYEYLNALGDEE